MDIGPAGPPDLPHLARLLWIAAAPDQQAQRSVDAFATDLDAWWADHAGSHVAFVARRAAADPVGMAWLALVPRPPRPGLTVRRSADVQSVFVRPEERGRGVGSALVRAATDHALRLGAEHVTVHSNERAVPVYERLGFTSSPLLLQFPAE